MLILQLVLVGFVFLFSITSTTNTSRHICKYSTKLAWIRVVWPLTSSKTWPSNLSYVSKSLWSIRYFTCPDRHNLKDASLVVLTCSFERAWLTQKRHWMIDIDDADISGCMIIVVPVMWIFAAKIIKNISLNAWNLLLFSKYQISGNLCLSQWPCFLRCGSASACLLGFCVRIYSGTWMSVYFECCIRTYLKDLMPNWKACSVKNMLTNFTWYTNTNLTQAIFVQCKSTYFNAHKFCCVLSETGFSVCIGKW